MISCSSKSSVHDYYIFLRLYNSINRHTHAHDMKMASLNHLHIHIHIQCYWKPIHFRFA